MYYKLCTSLKHFRFNRIPHNATISVEWYRRDLDENLEENISPFSDAEIDEFLSFTLANNLNFSGGKNKHIVKKNDHPIEIMENFIFSAEEGFPDHLILAPNAEILVGRNSAKSVFISLLDEKGYDLHNYNLKFGVIGKIVG